MFLESSSSVQLSLVCSAARAHEGNINTTSGNWRQHCSTSVRDGTRIIVAERRKREKTRDEGPFPDLKLTHSSFLAIIYANDTSNDTFRARFLLFSS